MSILVVGFGNALSGDDGAGPAVVERLCALGPTPGLRAENGGTDVLRLPALWKGESDVWIVDALRRGAAPGTIHHLDHDALLAVPQVHGSAHELSLPEGVRWLRLADPEMAQVHFRLWGIEPQWLGATDGLSPAVEWSVGAVAGEILRMAGQCLPSPSATPARSA